MPTTELQRDRAAALEPALEGILRDADVSEEVMMVLRVLGVTRRDVLVNLDSTEEGFRQAFAHGFSLDPAECVVHRIQKSHLDRRLVECMCSTGC